MKCSFQNIFALHGIGIIIHCYQFVVPFTSRCDKAKENMTNEGSLFVLKDGQDPNWEQSVLKADEAESEEEPHLPEDLVRQLEKEDHLVIPSEDPTETLNLGTEEEPKELRMGTLITANTRCRLIELLSDFIDVFAWSYEDMPGLDREIVQHRLPLRPECKPVQQKLRRMRPEMILKIKEEVRKQWDAGFLSVAQYPEWVANIVPVPKKGGKVRMCVDYRDLNKASPKDNFPLPHIDTLVDNTAKHNLFSFMDGFSGYNQIRMDPEYKERTTFITLWGTFCYNVMPFGLKNVGATYQRAMVTLFHDMMHKEVEVYVDDMIAKSQEKEDHIEVLRKLFLRLRKYQLKLNPAKCTFGATSGKLLGFVVNQRGIEIDPDKIKAIQEMPAPRTVKEVRGFLGRLNYIARFISQMTLTCEPMFKVLRKNNPEVWNDDCQEAFDKIKRYLTNPPILVPPVPGKPLILYLTIHDTSMGCVLGQRDDSGKKEQAIYYLSKKFTTGEANYSPLERVCCALVWTMRRLRQYTLYHTTWLISKYDPLKYLLEKPSLTGRIAKWQLLLSEYDILYVPQKAIKGSAIADYLADRALNDHFPLLDEFPDEHINSLQEEEDSDKWTLWFDGASCATGHGIGAVLISPTGEHYPMAAKLTFPCTNNIAEYEACWMGLQEALNRGIKQLQVFGDSALVIYQLRGEWETRNSKLIPYQRKIAEMAKQFEEISFEHMPREQNQLPDALATLASLIRLDTSLKVRSFNITIQETPAHCMATDGTSTKEKPWFHDIREYLLKQSYPEEASESEKRNIRRSAANYFLDGSILYKRNYNMVLLRCVDKDEATKITKEVHEGDCGSHSSGHTLARQIMRMGYYWATMENDCVKYVRECHKCQIYGDRIHVPPSQLHVMTSPWPFSLWGMDVIGAISPKASNGHRFILVAIDYFTKWVEAASYAHVTQAVVVKFIRNNIICRYGLPEQIITDNATNLNSKMMDNLCEKFKIQHRNSTPYRPQMNGAVEAANKNLKNIIRKTTETYKDWHEKLPYALYAYRTSVRTSTGATPFSLVYGTEAVLPIEVEIPSLRILKDTQLEEAEWVKNRFEQLNLIEGKRLAAVCRGQLYQQRMMASFNKKVRPRIFKEGDLVLKKVLPMQHDHRGKWTPNYEGPYVVKRTFSGGALILARMDGNELPNPVNSDAVKKYYV